MITRTLVLSVGLLVSALHAAETPVEDLLRQGLFEEEANRDFDKAAERYRAVVAGHDKQRALAATATYRLGEIARKKNDKDAAVAAFRTVVERFQEQTDLVRMSRENLATLGALPVPSPAAGNEALGGRGEIIPEDPEDTEISRLKKIATNSPDMIDGADPDGWKPIHHAARKGQVKVVSYLLANRASPDGRTLKEQLTPLQIAAIHGHLGVITALLAAKAEINATFLIGNCPKELLPASDQGVDRLSGEWAALELATLYDRKEIARALLKAGADFKRRGPGFGGFADRTTTLPLAIYLGRNDIAGMLLEAGASTRPEVGEKWTTPLNMAIQFNTSFVPVLLDAGADPNLRVGEERMPPLLIAASGDKVETAKLLLEKGADVKAVNATGQSPLFYARGAPMAGFLISRGVDPNVKSTDGLTALDAVAARNSPREWDKEADIATLRVLLEHGAVSGDAKSLMAKASPALRPIVRERVVYPAEYRDNAVLIALDNSSFGVARMQTIETRPVPGSPPPTVPEVLCLYYKNGSNSELERLRVLRRDGAGAFAAVLDWKPADKESARTDFPALEWGDIVEVSATTAGTGRNKPNLSTLTAQVAPRNVSIRMGGVEFHRTLKNHNGFWLGSTSRIGDGGSATFSPDPVARDTPWFTYLTWPPQLVDPSRMEVIRKGVKEPIAVDVSQDTAPPFRLIEGDEIRMVLLDSAREQMEKNGKVLLLTDDFVCGGLVREDQGRFSALAGVGGSMDPKALSGIDWSKVTLLPGGDFQKAEITDFKTWAASLRQGAGWDREDLLKRNTLHGGDWIILPSLPKDADEIIRAASLGTYNKIREASNFLMGPGAAPPQPRPRVVPTPPNTDPAVPQSAFPRRIIRSAPEN